MTTTDTSAPRWNDTDMASATKEAWEEGAIAGREEAADTIESLTAENARLVREVAEHKQDNGYVIGWNAGWDEAFGRMRFPTMLRKMWSGGEVQKWLDQCKSAQTGPVAGSLTGQLQAAEARVTALEAECARMREAVRAAGHFFKVAMPQINIKDSALDCDGIDAWNKAEIAIARAARKEQTP